MRTRRFGRGHWLIRMGSICVLLSFGLTLAASKSTENWGVATIGAILVLLQVALIILLTPSLAAGLISGERESGGWTLMQMTPLSPVRIVWGKLVSVAMPLLLILVATLPGYGVMIVIDDSQAMQVVRVLITLLLTAAFALLLTAAVSSLFRRTAVATAVSYTLLVALIAGTMLIWAGRDAPFTQHTVESVLKFNPLAAALQLIRAPGFREYQLVPTTWSFMGIACVVFLLILIVQTWRLTRPR
jgi:ABC-type transport system involved in multi-copper enzyme maturation permease subunit